MDGETDKERVLTELGREQAKSTGLRLKELNLPLSTFIISTMTRAQETGKIILSHFEDKSNLEIKNDSLIEEGAPIPPEPKVGHWRPQPAVIANFFSTVHPYKYSPLAVLHRWSEN